MVKHLATDIGEIHTTPAHSVGFKLDIRGEAAQPVIVRLIDIRGNNRTRLFRLILPLLHRFIVGSDRLRRQ
ncbi:hypothetical protein D3C78_1156730 [compost metagenome]